MDRVFLIIADSLGVGAAPDAINYKPVPGGDVGSHTLWHTIDANKGLNAPTLQQLGLANVIGGHPLWPAIESPIGFYGKMTETSAGKDTPSGHWEIAGCPVPYQMPVYYDGLPKEMMDRFVKRVREKGIELAGVLGGQPASGTEIISLLGEESLLTKKPIVYTSGDSVFQIAAHETYFGLEKLYTICKIARDVLNEYPDKIGRVIARPFIGESKKDFKRTSHRHDYSLEPMHNTILDVLKKAGRDVIGVGKIGDIFAHRGLTQEIHSDSNHHGMTILTELAQRKDWEGLAFINLCDFDVLYGHRRNAKGYATAIEEFDCDLKNFLPSLTENEVILITSDHGCDPTFAGTDHTREFVPILLYQSSVFRIPYSVFIGRRTTVDGRRCGFAAAVPRRNPMPPPNLP